jgi:TonB family protein
MKLVTEFGITRKQGIRMVFIDRNYQPFSFFGIVFIPENLKESDSLPQILEHERVHVRQVHSLDLLLMEILTILHWFNPFIWFYRRSLKSIHEYLADEGVIVKGYDKVNYQELLLGQTLGIQVNDLTNNFNHSLLKSRIIMMTKQRSGTFSGWKTTLAIPVLLGLVMIFSTSVYTGRSNENQQQDKLISAGGKPMPVLMASVYYPDEDSIKRASGKEPVYEVVKTMPEFQGGFDALVKYLVANIKYPEDAKKNGIQGTVFVSFVVEKDGKVSNVSLMKGVDPALDAEALRVVKTMPAWSPGLNDDGKAVNVRFNLPISFKLDGDAKKEEKK